MVQDASKSATFIDSYNSGISPYLNGLSTSFFERTNFDRNNIIERADDIINRNSIVSSEMLATTPQVTTDGEVAGAVSTEINSAIAVTAEQLKNIDVSKFLKGKINQIIEIIQNDKDQDSFGKLKSTGKILLEIAPEIINNTDTNIKRSGSNIINGFFDIAKQTEDEELLNTAVKISEINIASNK